MKVSSLAVTFDDELLNMNLWAKYIDTYLMNDEEVGAGKGYQLYNNAILI